MEVKKITSVNNPFIKKLYKIKTNKKETLKSGLILVEGTNNINTLMELGLVEYILTTREDVTEEREISVGENVLEKLSSLKNSNSDIAVAKMPVYENKKYKRVVMLENVQDPGNLGTIIRSTLAFGFDAVYVSKDSAFIYNAKVVSASQGAIFQIPVFQQELEKTLDIHEYDLYVTHLSSDAIKIDEFEPKESFAIAFGNEGKGISESLLSRSKGNLIIPIKNVDSLNVAIASSIAIYELSKKL